VIETVTPKDVSFNVYLFEFKAFQTTNSYVRQNFQGLMVVNLSI
jgi:hypothetical protein